MKRIIVVSLLLLFIIANFAIAELTMQDLDKIKVLLDDQKKDITEQMNIAISAVEKSLSSAISAVEKSLSSEISAVEKSLKSRIDAVEREQESLQWLVIILVGIFGAILAVIWAVVWNELRKRRNSPLPQPVEELNADAANAETSKSLGQEKGEDFKPRAIFRHKLA